MRALQLYGECVFTTLASARHFNEWLREQKSQDTTKPLPSSLGQIYIYNT